MYHHGIATGPSTAASRQNQFMKKSPLTHIKRARAAIILVVAVCGVKVFAQGSTAPVAVPNLSLSKSLASTTTLAAVKPSDVAPARPAGNAAPASTAAVGAATASAVRVLLAPDIETLLLAQTVGRITSLNGSLGSRVAKGQLVVGMDCTENTAKLKMSQAELASARETYDSKVRLKGLDAAGEVEVALAAAAVARADGQIEMTKAQIKNCSVYAPFAGRIAKMHVKPFQGVAAGQPLFEVVSEGPPRLRLNVPSKWLKTIKVGTAFQVEIDETGKSYQAGISAINARVDAVAQTVEIEARVVGKFAELLPGMSGTAHFANTP
jgi:membrane fusion protein, multidrug efflux system